MIVFENGSCRTNSRFSNSNFLSGFDCDQPKWVVDDSSELAKKILAAESWEPVEDDNGKLIDISIIEAAAKSQDNAHKITELKAQLDEIDRQAIRPLRAIAAGTDTDEDTKILAELESRAESIRAEIAQLSEGKEKINGHTDNESGA